MVYGLSMGIPVLSMHGIQQYWDYLALYILGAILFANHKANGVVTNIGLSR